MPNNYNKLRDDLFCKYCGKQCKSLNSLSNHERTCPSNKNRKYISHTIGHTPWNKGLTKETDERVLNQSIKESASKKGKPGHKHTDAEKQNLSIKAKENNLGGFNWRKGIYYNGIKLDSSYEVILAENLDENKIRWERPSKFKYYDLNNIEHSYTPDFYLPDYDIYLDPKNDYLINNVNPVLGYSDVDKINWVCKQNGVRIFILNKDQLNWNYIASLV